ncbi:hypothetical protein [Streptomyces filamentosus]|uniref:hypothetical protein n=1 Tax=Streptomyces filamentosus TaxID=67294 RepID=UPI0037CCF572
MTTALNPRQSWLLSVIGEEGGRWASGRVQTLYRARRQGCTQRGTARRDLIALARHGLLIECGPTNGRYYLPAPRTAPTGEQIPVGEPQLLVYRAAYDAMPMGLYTTPDAARAHCEDSARDELGRDREMSFDWLGDEDDPLEPRELVVQIGPFETTTNYTVTALEVATEYDPEADS